MIDFPKMPELNEITDLDALDKTELNEKHFDDQYPIIVSSVMEYILEQKENSSAPLLELINDYCFKNNLPVELVGDAIANDVYFKSFIQTDCELHNIIRSDKNELQEW